ncbi:MBL fold metallo-hydrolase, partial [Patescibacteria group bacterium]|nr:MBL fold metallo-hydrolase [Patescibacteria group bacterium]
DLVMPYTDSSIDFVVLTHPHADHLDGLVEVLERFEVGAVLITGVFADDDTYFEFLDKVAEVPVYFAESGTDFLFGDLKMDVLYPFSQIVGEEFKNLNNSSVVLMIESGDLRILLTGDAEGEVEQELIERYFGKLKSDILKAGHHGSKTASSAGFLSVVRPDVVVVQVGEGNSFSHPHEESLRAFEALGATVRRNDLEGIIEFIF